MNKLRGINPRAASKPEKKVRGHHVGKKLKWFNLHHENRFTVEKCFHPFSVDNEQKTNFKKNIKSYKICQ